MNLLDSNILIYSSQAEYAYLRSFIFDKESVVSKVTCLEVFGFHKLDEASKQYFVSCFQFLHALSISDTIIDAAIDLRQQRKMSLGDAIIAATALNYDATVMTRNTDDFLKIDGIKVINPIHNEFK